MSERPYSRLRQSLGDSWALKARPEQLPPPGAWNVWVVCAGRGWGKTRTGAEWIRTQKLSGCRRMAIVAPTAADARDVMVEGESGIMATSPNHDRPEYEPSKRRLTWPNGALATVYSADEPSRLRGPQHDAAWCDELASWSYAESWEMLMLGMRLGKNPRTIVTTTPKPVKLIRDLVARSEAGSDVVITRGSTFDNRENLAESFFTQVVSQYEGTRLGRQELDAELLSDVPGALWSLSDIEATRISPADMPPMRRIVIAIDPPITSGEHADECGVIVGGIGSDGHGYILEDCSRRGTPDEWARVAVAAYRRHKADRIVAEVNQGGQMVETVIRTVDPNIPYTAVHASRGKVVRAEPIAALYEQKRIHHVGPFFNKLEDQMTSFTTDFSRSSAGYSPDRVDALVWCMTSLMVGGTAPLVISDAMLARAKALRDPRGRTWATRFSGSSGPRLFSSNRTNEW